MNKIVLIAIGALVLVGILGFALSNKGGGNKSDIFPTPTNVKNFTKTGENGINYQTSLTIQEVENFYRSELTAQGLTEKELLTAKTETTLSFVFEGHTSGMSLVVQAVKLDTGTNVNVRLESL